MEDPVVVNPDMVSKKASVKLGIAPERINGKQPNKLIQIQPQTTIKYPSLFLISAFLYSLVKIFINDPHSNVIPLLISISEYTLEIKSS